MWIPWLVSWRGSWSVVTQWLGKGRWETPGAERWENWTCQCSARNHPRRDAVPAPGTCAKGRSRRAPTLPSNTYDTEAAHISTQEVRMTCSHEQATQILSQVLDFHKVSSWAVKPIISKVRGGRRQQNNCKNLFQASGTQNLCAFEIQVVMIGLWESSFLILV